MNSREIPLLKPSFQMDTLNAIEKDPDFYKELYQQETTWMDEDSCQEGSGIRVPEGLGLVLDPKESLAWNAKALHQALIGLTRTQACNPFLWGRLCHFECWNWVRSRRWPEEEKKTTFKHIRDAFFVKSYGSRYLTRNALSKLWWIGYHTHVGGKEYRNTEILIEMPEIIERTYGRSYDVTRTVVDFFAAKKDPKDEGKKIKQFRNSVARPILKALNRHGAVALLSNEDDKAIGDFLEAEYQRVEKDLQEQGETAAA